MTYFSSIDNPLLHQTRTRVTQDAGAFHERHQLGEVVEQEIFVRAALVARDPDDYGAVEGLTQIERRALESEQSPSFWKQAKLLTRESRIILLTCCIAAVVQGWDQSTINGANLGWPSEFGLSVNLRDPNKNSGDVWLFGLVNASTYLSAALV